MTLNRTMKYWGIMSLVALVNSVAVNLAPSTDNWGWLIIGLSFAMVWNTAEMVGKTGLGENA